MQFMSRSTSPNRPTRKKDRKVVYAFNKALKAGVDRINRKKIQDAALLGTEAAMLAAVEKSARIESEIDLLREKISAPDSDPGLIADLGRVKALARAADNAKAEATVACARVLVRVDKTRRRERRRLALRRLECQPHIPVQF